jgi:hypothetical protein
MPRSYVDKLAQGTRRVLPNLQKLITGTPPANSWMHLFQFGPSPAAGTYPGAALAKLAAYVGLYLDAEEGPGECQSIGYTEWVEYMRNASLGGPPYRLWFWQTCTSQGKAQTSAPGSTRSPFSDLGQDADAYYASCADVFGAALGNATAARGTAQATATYGGQALVATDLMLVNGNADPWSEGGILHSDIPGMHSVVIDGASHCANMDEPQPDDSPSMKAARADIDALLQHVVV